MSPWGLGEGWGLALENLFPPDGAKARKKWHFPFVEAE